MKVAPVPVQQWNQSTQKWMTGLYVAFSLSWALEIVSHLEGKSFYGSSQERRHAHPIIELNFWLFLLTSKPEGSWLHSVYFYIWGAGSLLALGGLPTVAIITRHDALKVGYRFIFIGMFKQLMNVSQSEAWIFFTGSTGSLIITIFSLYVV